MNDRKISVGIVGTGWMGEQLLRRVHEHPNASVGAVFDMKEENAKAAMMRHGVDPTLYVPRYEDMLADTSIDAVVLVSPNAFHAKQSLAALSAGKHVMSEKPNAVSWQDHRAIIDAARKNPSLVTMTDYIFFFDHMVERVKRDIIEKGHLGQITQAQFNYRNAVNVSGDKAWKLRKDIIGDAIGMAITHSVFAMIHMLAPAKPVSVFATSNPGTTGQFEVPPIWNILITFDNGATGFLFGDIEQRHGYDAFMHVYGSKGVFFFDSQAKLESCVRFRSTEMGADWVYPLDHEENIPANEQFRWPKTMSMPNSGDVMTRSTKECIDHFIACIRGKMQSPLSFEHARSVQDINFAAQASAALKCPVAIPTAESELAAIV